VVAADRQSDAAMIRSETFYAQSWALCYYLARHRPGAFAAYLGKIRSRRPGEKTGVTRELADFEANFGTPDTRFEQNWLRAMQRLEPHRAK
jgi:hypothetical protein